jgi:hypothetical protein
MQKPTLTGGAPGGSIEVGIEIKGLASASENKSLVSLALPKQLASDVMGQQPLNHITVSI